MTTFKQAISFERLYESMIKCKKNVLWKDSVASFDLNAIEKCIKLEKSLNESTYESSKPHTFTVTSPKKRDIVSIGFKDRVFQRSLNDNVLYPIMTKFLIYDNAACQIGKGTDFARNRLKEFIHRTYRKGKASTAYILQIDIKGYYPNMDHQLVEDMFRKYLSADVYQVVKKILNRQYPGTKGYNPGSQLIQIAGIAFLNDLDHYCKEQLKCKFYLRYMDDIIIFNDNKEQAILRLKLIREFLSNKKLETNQKKTKVYLLSKGITFLGFKFLLTETGKVLLLIKPESIKRERKHLRNIVRRIKEGRMTVNQVDECFQSWIAHAEKGNSYKLINRMKEYYKGVKNANLN